MKINVLMSTYNGERYLAEQMESVFSQSVDGVFLTVRDDGSEDGTIEILKKYGHKKNYRWYSGANSGCAKSFWNLINNSEDADYYAFCDQDDVWDNDKLLIAVNALEKGDKNLPLLYFSDVRVTDADLNTLKDGMADHMPADYARSLIANIAPGCTYVFNKKAKELLLKYDADKYGIDIHDWTAYRIIACFGKVFFDESAHMSYRQHGDNEIGATYGGIRYVIEKFKNFNGGAKNKRRDCALRLEQCYGAMMSAENAEITRFFAHYDTDKKLKKLFIKDKRFYFRGFKYKFFVLLIRLNKI